MNARVRRSHRFVAFALLAGALLAGALLAGAAHAGGIVPKILASHKGIGVGVYVARRADGSEQLYVVDQGRPAAAVATLALGPGTRKAKLTPDWQGIKGLLEVQIASDFSNGQRELATTRHVLLRRDAAGLWQLACAFDGRVASAMESSGTETTATITIVNQAPLTFEIVYEARATRWGPRRGTPPEKTTSRFELVEGGVCKDLTPPRPTGIR